LLSKNNFVQKENNVKKCYDDQLRLALFRTYMHEKYSCLLYTFQHYRVTQRLSGTTVLETRPKV